MMASGNFKIEDLIKELEEHQNNGNSFVRNISDTLYSLNKTISKLKRDKTKIDPRNCADCNTRRQSFMRRFLGLNKRPTSDQQNELETVYTELKITKDEKGECEKELETTKAELKKTTKERDNIIKQLEVQTEANAVLVDTMGENKIHSRELETMRKSNDQLKAKNENLTKTLDEMKKDNEKLMEDLKLQEQNCESSVTEISELKNTIKQAQNDRDHAVNDLKDELDKLKAEMKRSEDENEHVIVNLRSEVNEWKSKAQQSQREDACKVNRLQTEVMELKANLSSKNTEIAEIKRQMNKHVCNTSQTEEKNREIQMFREEVNILKSELEEKKRREQNTEDSDKELRVQLDQCVINLKQEKEEANRISCRVISLESELNSLKSKCIELETDNNMLTASKKSLQKHIDGLRNENKRFNQDNADLEQELKSSKSKLETINREKDRLKTDVLEMEKLVEELKTLKAVLTSELELSKRENKKLVQQIEQLTKKPRRLIELNVLSSMKQGLTDIVMHDLSGKLKQISDTEDIDVVLRPTVTAANVKGPTVVFCISISRLGTDVQEALKGVSVSSDVAIIIFHHKEAHALPSLSSEKILTGSDYKQLGSIIDMAVLSSKGIYNCDMNNLGFTKLVTFAKRFMK